MKLNKKALIAISAASLFAATFLCWLMLELIYVVSIDDVMYAGWTQHGFKNFIKANVWHYQNFNGRAFIHVIMQLVLVFNEHLYAIIFPFFISGSTFILTTIIKKDWNIYQRLFASALALFTFFCLGKTVLTNTAIWMAGGFNYVFPLIVVIGGYWIFLRYRKKNIALLYLIPLAFLCGATTEQYGMYTIGLIVMTYFFDTIDEKKLDWRGFAYLAAAIGGLLTIMLAPPTQKRLDTTGRSLLSGIRQNWKFFGGEMSEVIFPIAFMLLIGIFALFKKTKTDESGEKVKYRLYNPLLISGIPFAITAGIFTLFNNYVVSEVLTYIFVALAAVTMFLKKETRTLGMIIVCGFGTFFMMGLTWISEYRTCVPCILSFVIVLAIMLVDTLSEITKKIVTGIIAAVLSGACFIVGYFPAYMIYREESVLSKEIYEQFKSAETTGVFELNWDYNYSARPTRFRNKTMTDMYPFNPILYFQAKYDIPTNVKYLITSEKEIVYNVRFNDFYSYVPAIERDGTIFVPFMFPHIEISMYEEFFPVMLYDQYGNFVGMRAKENRIYCPRYDILQIGSAYFVKLDYVLDQWDYEFEYDEEENTLVFTTQDYNNNN